MPVYTYACPAGHEHEEWRRVDDRDRRGECGHVEYRCRQCGQVRVGGTDPAAPAARPSDKVCGAEVSEAKLRGGVATFEVTRCGGALERSGPCDLLAERPGVEREQARLTGGGWSGRVTEYQRTDPVSGWEQNYRVVRPGAGIVPGGD